MFWHSVLVSDKNIGYPEAVYKRYSKKVAILKKPALQILWTCGQSTWKQTSSFLQAFIFLIVFKTDAC